MFADIRRDSKHSPQVNPIKVHPEKQAKAETKPDKELETDMHARDKSYSKKRNHL